MSGAVERIEAALGAVEAAREVSHDAACGGRYGIAYLLVDCRLIKGHDGDCATANAARRALPEMDRCVVDGLRKVVALHQPIQMLTGPVCTSCGDADEHAVAWPCATLASLAAALDPGVGDGREVRGE